MKVTVFTSNQLRHIALVNDLVRAGHYVTAVVEVTTVHPGTTPDFYRKSEVMQKYFRRVLEAEQTVFGSHGFMKATHVLPLKMGDLNGLPVERLMSALDGSLIIVFGASYIRPPLVQYLVARRAINIHMGISPYYRGSGCNFWALWDGNADLVGATIHLLSEGLDSGDILFHTRPSIDSARFDPFLFGMLAVRSAFDGLLLTLEKNLIFTLPATPQDRALQIRYSRNAEFTDDVVAQYLVTLPDLREVVQQCSRPRRAGLRFLEDVWGTR